METNQLYNLTLTEKLDLIDEGKYLDIFAKDSDWAVREAVAYKDHALETLINDKEWIVRLAVAKKGYRPDILINDPEHIVRQEAAKWLSKPQNQQIKM